MKFLTYSRLARILFGIGEHVTTSYMHKLDNCINFVKSEQFLNFLEMGRWFKTSGYSFRNSSRFADRDDLYTAIASKIEDEVVLYLEFGVWQGASLCVWSRLLRNPLSSLHGFDSFEGLPEAFSTLPKGSFDVKGALPQFDDPRISLHKGWFHETLPGFVLPEHERLLINLDADLYLSTKYVLDTLREAICPGTIIIFDELNERLHELKAFSEFLETNRMKFRFLGGALDGAARCVFERIA
jgi:Macrocin-O-methyltransferase (TylF)